MSHAKMLTLPTNLVLGPAPFQSIIGYYMPHNTEKEIRQTAIAVATENPDDTWYLDGITLVSDRGMTIPLDKQFFTELKALPESLRPSPEALRIMADAAMIPEAFFSTMSTLLDDLRKEEQNPDAM